MTSSGQARPEAKGWNGVWLLEGPDPKMSLTEQKVPRGLPVTHMSASAP